MRSERDVRRQAFVAGAVLGTALFLKVFVTGVPVGFAASGNQDEGMLFRRNSGNGKQEEMVKAEEDELAQARVTVASEPAGSEDATGKNETAAREELKQIEKELLRFPKKDRLRFGNDSDMTHDTNPGRNPIRHSKGDTTFKLSPYVQVDLGGRKTDVRLEYRTRHTYNVKRSKVSGNDSSAQEETLRAGRKIFPRTLLSLNQRLVRGSTRFTGMDDKKIEWDQSYRSALSYRMNRKFSINLDGSNSRTDFPHENFDQDKTHTWTLSPSLAFQMTPKTQFSGNYNWTYSRSLAKASDNSKHEYRVGYIGQITPKSSVSVDVSLSRQLPFSANAATTKSVVWDAGYIWQMTPKTNLRLLYSTSLSDSLSDAVATSGSFTFTKTRTYSRSDSLSVSTRFRVHRKINLDFSFNGSHSRTKSTVTEGEPSLTKSRLWTFPFQIGMDYDLVRWIRLRFTYTYQHQIGDERKTDEFRAHTFFLAANASV